MNVINTGSWVSWSKSFWFTRSVCFNTRWLNGKESACQCRRRRFDPWMGRAPGWENGNALQYPCLENPVDRGAWWATVHGVTKSQTQLSDWARMHTCMYDDQWSKRKGLTLLNTQPQSSSLGMHNFLMIEISAPEMNRWMQSSQLHLVHDENIAEFSISVS